MSKTKAYVDYILELMRSGDIDRSIIVSKFCKKFQTTERTADTYWKDAKEAYNVELDEIKSKSVQDYRQNELERLKSQILDRDKILEMQSNLVKLAYNKMVKAKEPLPSDLQAYNSTIERYSKLLGLDAPKQIEQKTTVESINIIIE
jgi:hypothetical protein